MIAGLEVGILLRSPLPLIADLKLDEIHLTPHLILVLFLRCWRWRRNLRATRGANSRAATTGVTVSDS
jgi:hypothetical protein